MPLETMTLEQVNAELRERLTCGNTGYASTSPLGWWREMLLARKRQLEPANDSVGGPRTAEGMPSTAVGPNLPT